MLIFEEEGIRQSFKIILNTRGIVIKTKGLLSSYKEVYSRLYHHVNTIRVTNKFIQTEFVIDNVVLNFGDNDEAKIISNLISLGKSNIEGLIRYINQDSFEVDINEIDLEQLEHDVMSNRFNREYSQTSYEPVDKAEKTQVGISNAATLEHMVNMRLKAMGVGQQEVPAMQQKTTQSPSQMQTPAAPPPIGASCFSFYAYIEGKQQGPYDEKQFATLVQYGQIKADTPVWKEGMLQWQNANTVPETMIFFQRMNNQVPPPPPID